MTTWQLSLVKKRSLGFSIIEVITAVAILGIGIWAIVALFPKGQNIIRRSGLRQMATQMAHEAISDYLAEPSKLPYAILPFAPNLVPNRPVLFEPAYLSDVRRAYNLVWGEPLDDGLPSGDPNKRVGLVAVDLNNDGQPDEWRSILRFVPALPVPNWDTNGDNQPEIRVYREIRYLPVTIDRNGDGFVNGLDVREFEFFFDQQSSQVDVYLAPLAFSIPRLNAARLLRVSYELANPMGPIAQVNRELYIVSTSRNSFTLNQPASRILSIVEEFPLSPKTGALGVNEYGLLAPGVLRFGDPVPRPTSNLPANDPRIGSLRVDYIIDGVDGDGDGFLGEDLPNTVDDDGDGRVDEDMPGHWLVENGVTFEPDATIRRRMNVPAGVGVFQTTFGGLSPTAIQALWLDMGASWGLPLTVSPSSDFQSGNLVLLEPNNRPLPPNARVRVAFLTADDWFAQVIKLPDDFQLLPPSGQNTNDVLQWFPYEQLRWFEFDAQRVILRFSPLLAGLSLQIRWLAPNGVKYDIVSSISADGSVQLPPIDRLISVQNASVLIRVSGRTLWQQAPPSRKSDFVELVSIIPPAQVSLP